MSSVAAAIPPDGGDVELRSDPPDRTDHEIHDDLIAALRVGVLRLSRRLRLERDGDLTLTQLSVLGTIAREGALTIGELANHERVKPPSMTRTVTFLEEAGLVTRCTNDNDGRQVIVKLTDSALGVLADTRRRRDDWLREHLRDLSPADRALLEAAAPLLDRLAQS